VPSQSTFLINFPLNILRAATDHLLSYFLGANDGTNDSSNPESDVAVTADQSVVRRSFQSSGNASTNGITAVDSTLENFVSSRAKESSDGLTSATSTSTSAPSVGMELPLRSVHFDDGNRRPLLANQQMFRISASDYTSFAHAPQQQWQSSDSLQNRSSSVESMHKVLSTSSTTSHGSASSLLTSMASALALGEPNQVIYMQQKLQIRDQLTNIQYQLNNTSPITPVNLLGSPQEMMMLPPPPRVPNGSMPGMMQHHHQSFGQQHIIHSQQQQQRQTMIQPQMPQPQAAPLYFDQQTVNAVSTSQANTQQSQQHPNFMPLQANVQQRQQQPKFLPSQTNVQQQQRQHQPNFLPQMNPTHSQPLEQNRHVGFPDPNSYMSSSSILPPQVSQAQQSQQPQQQGTPFQQQIQIGLNGQTIPITAIPGANGSIIYQVDPSVVPTSGLRYFTKAINEVSKADDQKEIDPEVLAEKRRQRLARNRESARQSRRRKKEHLASLAAKVQKLQRQLEAEVRSKIRSMEGGLARQRCNMVNKWLAEQEKKRSCSASNEHSSGSISSRDSRNQLAMVIDKTSVNCEIRRAVIAHQYHFLRQAFISSHNRYSVWMMLQSSSFFTEASRQQEVALAKTGVAAGSISSGSESASKTASSRANSKQIGEDIFNEDRKRGNGSVICHANYGVRMWPLFCREITMTMDQEDRVINQAHAQ
jgi:hypothetical protein